MRHSCINSIASIPSSSLPLVSRCPPRPSCFTPNLCSFPSTRQSSGLPGPPGPPGSQGLRGPRGLRGRRGRPGSGDSVVGQNVGTEGIGVYVGKVNDTLQFRNITSDNAIDVDNQSNNIVISPIIGGTSNTLAPGNDPRFATPNLIQVKNSNPGFGEFTSIAAAITSITDAAEDNPYLIQVGPGIYTEPELVVPSWVHVTGSTVLPTVIQPDADNHHILRVMSNTEISFLNLQGAGPGFAAIASIDAGDFTQAFKVSIMDSDIGVLVTATTEASYSYLEYIDINGSYRYGLIVRSENGVELEVNTENFYLLPGDNTTINHVLVEGTEAMLTVLTSRIVGIEDSSIGYRVIDGGQLKLLGTTIDNVETCIQVSNGAQLELGGGSIDSSYTDIHMTSEGLPSILHISGTASTLRAKNLLIVEHPGGRGKISGFADAINIYIHPLAPFDIVGRQFNTVTVGKRDSMYTSVATALASINPTVMAMITSGSTMITSNQLFNVSMSGFQIVGSGIPNGTIFSYQNESVGVLSNAATLTGTFPMRIIRANPINSFNVNIGSGIYIEPTITVPSFVAVDGTNKIVTTIVTQSQDQNGIIMSSFSSLFRLTVQGARGVGYAAVVLENVNFTEVRDCLFQDSYMLIRQTGGTISSITSVTDCFFVGDYTYAMYLDGSITSGVSQPTLMVVKDIGILNQATASSTDMRVFGPFASLSLTGSSFQGNGMNTLLQCLDGARIKFVGNHSTDAFIGINVINEGLAPDIQIASTVIVRTISMDMIIDHPGTTGVIDAVLSQSKTSIDPSAPLSVNYVDPIDPGLIVVGTFQLGPTNTSAVDIQPLIYRSSPLGAIEGGQLTRGTGLSVNIAAGFGYLEEDSVERRLLLFNWPTTNIELTANATFYIYLNSAGTIVSSLSPPPFNQSILFGRVRTSTSSIEFVESVPIRANHPDNLDDKFQREALGSIYVSGSIVTANASRQIAVSSGRYYYSVNEFNPSGKAFTDPYLAYFHAGGTAFTFTSQTVVDNSQYDNGANLVPLDPGTFTKHSLYIVGEGANEQYMLVYGQAQYATSDDARAAPLPSPPPYFTNAVTLIASLVVQEGNSAIVVILSERPSIGITPSSITGTINHGDLLGLLNDDHPQYLLTNGDRALTGNLNLDSNNIINVGTVNGVVVESHASRHLPNSVTDPLATAAPDTNLTATSTNFAGTANSFARSNHTHAITTGPPSTLQPDQPNTTGTSAALARADHIHNIPTAAPITSLSATTTNTRGTAATFARSDHTHAISTGTPTTTLSANTTNAPGTAATLARSDHTHAISTGVASTITPDLANATGTSAALARADHIHNIPSGIPVVIGTANVRGTAASFALSDHVHQGVHSINTTGGNQLYGDITLNAGSGVEMDQTGNTITISSTSANPSNGYLYVYDTTNQPVIVANTYTPITFNTNGLINGWTRPTTSTFTPTNTGIYNITYGGILENTATSQGLTANIRITLNGVVVGGSTGAIQFSHLATQAHELSKSVIISITAGQILQFEFTASNTTVRLRANLGTGTNIPSANVTINRL